MQFNLHLYIRPMKNFFIIALVLCCFTLQAQTKKPFSVIAYYSAGPETVDAIPANKLTHIIFSFCHLKGNRLAVDNTRDTLTIKKLVGLKKINKDLKVILSLGGWGGCAPCSEAFSKDAGRKEFAQSVLELNQYFGTDGIDLDWEYPTIEGHPGHAYGPADKPNFTSLINDLRAKLGDKYEISFAAGGFQHFLDESVEWDKIMKVVDRVNLMTYDLINGYSTQTGHHTALYSRKEQKESTDNCVQDLIKKGVPSQKLVIGAAFYARVWENVPATNNGLYQSGKFKRGVDYKEFDKYFSKENGFVKYWDDIVKAPYFYSATQKLFGTGDDLQSIKIKTQYAIDHNLDGIMFWELPHDVTSGGLVDAIYEVKMKKK
jgi:chitinase